ncbi:DNA-3-methyladenine glycosylase I [Mongoliibacter ruber]|uniref:DNA-3-methyladenine glycosylase I n=1 Tax=Mongoliibacter ruber TaxID=1750599 RepID=A0A2T0WTA9_9BACT|nr:DNA-3-methyladenine glycosylase I [Mongoliibacter ruber]PRY89933.1 DNA-3-methyladenine glycosylase I [Mongoliibacter ruber]
MSSPVEPPKIKCPWCLGFDAYQRYHDEEWGVPVRDDRKQFEFLVLESAQAGLSWATILKKREGYRRAFAEFDYRIVAEFPESYIQELIQNKDIIRNGLKIRAAVNNARRFLEVQAKFGSFSDFIWDYVDGNPIKNNFASMQEVPATTKVSDKLAKDMKKLGFKFLGSTILYAHMQATGLVNDHLTSCFRHKEVHALK